jgi:hypothetical protein
MSKRKHVGPLCREEKGLLSYNYMLNTDTCLKDGGNMKTGVSRCGGEACDRHKSTSLHSLPFSRVIRFIFIGAFSGFGRVEQRMNIRRHARASRGRSGSIDALERIPCAGESPAVISVHGRWCVVVVQRRSALPTRLLPSGAAG